ncbi:hypothetical protein J6590_026072 [Homalodisca vitripennis]|nr:hypothetical protein J6590_026072 [Homalodisca vitripennis]
MFLFVFITLLYVSSQLGQPHDNHSELQPCLYKTITLSNNLRSKRSSNHVSPEEAVRIKNESFFLVEQLITVGNHVHKLLKDLPERKGSEFLKGLKDYNKAFEKFSDLIKHDNINTRKDVERFLQQPHPNIAETDYREWNIRTRFNWSDEHYHEFQQLMNIARELWIELIYLHTYY